MIWTRLPKPTVNPPMDTDRYQVEDALWAGEIEHYGADSGEGRLILTRLILDGRSPELTASALDRQEWEWQRWQRTYVLP